MSLATLISRATVGIQALEVSVEVHITRGKPSFSIVGLPETAVKESRDRVRSALLNSGFDFPLQRITVNLAPADLPKEGGRFDLPIAIGILAACGLLPSDELRQYEIAGELALSGQLKPFLGALLFSLATTGQNRQLILPIENAAEAALPENSRVYGATNLLAVYQHLAKVEALRRVDRPEWGGTTNLGFDLADVIGQPQAKRALVIAASGGHHLLMTGPPGTGKTMLAMRLPGLLPLLTERQALEVAAIRSLAGQSFEALKWRQRPFRAPHHTASSVALVGGSSPPRPGEISLAHHGVLFMDELPEFSRAVLEALREPLESGVITISRAAQQTEFPAGFQLIAAMNPCPCGFYGDAERICRCYPEQIKRYQSRLSGPFLDRMDLQVYVKPLLPHVLWPAQQTPGTRQNSVHVKAQVEQAWQIQWQRQQKLNRCLTSGELLQVCGLRDASQGFLEDVMQQGLLSMRAVHRLLRVARTIADLAQQERVHPDHLAEAVQYRFR